MSDPQYGFEQCQIIEQFKVLRFKVR